MAKTLTIIPVNEPRGEGNGWDKCEESQATAFEVDNGEEVIQCFDTRADAEAFVNTGAKHGETCGCKTCQQYVF